MGRGLKKISCLVVKSSWKYLFNNCTAPSRGVSRKLQYCNDSLTPDGIRHNVAENVHPQENIQRNIYYGILFRYQLLSWQEQILHFDLSQQGWEAMLAFYARLLDTLYYFSFCLILLRGAFLGHYIFKRQVLVKIS